MCIRDRLYIIQLTDEERSKLDKTIKNKRTCKTVLKRCQILRDLDREQGAGLTHAQIAHTYAVCLSTISNLIRDYTNKGIDYVTQYNISPNSAAALRKADGRAEAELIQLACAPPRTAIPAGPYTCWKKKRG